MTGDGWLDWGGVTVRANEPEPDDGLEVLVPIAGQADEYWERAFTSLIEGSPHLRLGTTRACVVIPGVLQGTEAAEKAKLDLMVELVEEEADAARRADQQAIARRARARREGADRAAAMADAFRNLPR